MDRMLDMDIDDALIEKPYGFEVGEVNARHFDIFPTTLGKLHVIRRHIDNLEINSENLSLNPLLEMLRVSKSNPLEVSKIIALSTLKKKRDIFDNSIVSSTADYLRENLSADEMAALLMFIISRDDIEKFKRHLGISNESERLKKILSAKEKTRKSKNDYTFGGKTVYGTLIDAACERYGWPFDYVMWGISYVNLCMMLADKVQSIYISDEEKKNISAALLEDGEVINMDDKDNAEVIKTVNWR